mmetsp:Transcript_70332/g.181257  ORF Transcript_70332/g.181257 Transcript_70332/m.181257 type:complete len:89 (+) Transcript_70332:65-331(+)
MQHPGESITEYAQATSTSAMWARIQSRGTFPMPVGRSYLVKAQDERTIIWGNKVIGPANGKWFFSDNILLACWIFPALLVTAMNKLPK